MIAELDSYLTGLVGQTCCRKRIGRGKTLSLGFGQKIFHGNPKLIDEYYGEWEIGSYYAAWRIIQGGRIVCASQDAVDSLDELQTRLSAIAFGPFVSLSQSTELDVRVNLEGGYHVDFLGTVSDDDETFHIIVRPSELYIGFSPLMRWQIGKSNQPWSPTDVK